MLQPNSSQSGTWVQVRPRTARNQPRRVEFRFYPEYVRAVWKSMNGETAPKTRGGVSLSPDGETLLFTDVIQIDGTSVFVNAWFIPARQPETYHLRVEIAAPQGIQRSVRLFLHWDKTQYSARLRKGEMFFEDITTPDFSRAQKNLPSRRLQLSFEFENDTNSGKCYPNGSANSAKHPNQQS